MSHPPFPLDPEALAEEIDIPLSKWPGNCHGIAEAVLRKAPCPGMRLVRGHYDGRISRDSVYRGGPQQHSWLQLADGRILDPTRWAMDRPKSPYIYVGPNDAYDEAGMVLTAKSKAASYGAIQMIGQRRPEDAVEDILNTLPAPLRSRLEEATANTSAFGILHALIGPVEHLKNPQVAFAAAEEAGLKLFIKMDNWMRVMEPEKVTVPPGVNRLFEAPPREELTEPQILFKTFCRFLSIEERELTFEDELEEYGITLNEFHDALNEMERWLRFDPNLPHLPSETRNVIALAALDLLGKGFGEELRVERYAESLGLPRLEFDRALQEFGEKSGLDLAWIYPPIRHTDRSAEHSADAPSPGF